MIHSPTKDFDRAEKYLRLRDQYQGPSEGQLRDMDQELSELTEIANQGRLTSRTSQRFFFRLLKSEVNADEKCR